MSGNAWVVAGVACAMNTPVDLQNSSNTERGRLAMGVRVLAAAALAAIMVIGIFVLGRIASDDVMAMVFTTVFFVLLAAFLGWLVWQRRELLVPLGATYVVVAGAAGVLLGLPLITDDVVEEDVIRVETPDVADSDIEATDSESTDSQPTDTDSTDTELTSPTEIASGQFESRVHPGEGTATLIGTPEGSTILTLTDFATDNGPDLLVYLVPADTPEGSIDGFVDLGTLRGNIGDQQYEVPVDAGAGWRVVVWCRAFAVNFTEATLA